MTHQQQNQQNQNPAAAKNKHISYSELKNWTTCPHYHKLVNLDKIRAFEGNEYTSFGTALHETCEKLILKETTEPGKYFLGSFEKQLEKLPSTVLETMDKDRVSQMETQGQVLSKMAIPALHDYFGEFEYVSIEEQLYENIEEFSNAPYKFKGYIDLVIKTPDGKHHIIDWKTCSWGWDSRKKNDKMITYQLTFYKYFWSKKHNVPLDQIETHFALLKRTAKSNQVELFRVTSGNKKIDNALKLLTKALYNINNKNFLKNRLGCKSPWGYCEFYNTEHCK